MLDPWSCMRYDLTIICKRPQCLATLLCVSMSPTRGCASSSLSAWPPTQGHGHRGQPLQVVVPRGQLCQASAYRLQPREAAVRRRQPSLASTAPRSCAALTLSARAAASYCVVAQACRRRQLVALPRRCRSEVVAPPPRRHAASPATTRARGVSSLTAVDHANFPLGCMLRSQRHDASVSGRRPRGVAVPCRVLVRNPLRTVDVPWAVFWSAHARALSPAARCPDVVLSTVPA